MMYFNFRPQCSNSAQSHSAEMCPESRRRLPDAVFENRGKVALTGKAEPVGDFCDGSVGGFKQLLGSLNPAEQDVFVRRYLRNTTKVANERTYRRIGNLR